MSGVKILSFGHINIAGRQKKGKRELKLLFIHLENAANWLPPQKKTYKLLIKNKPLCLSEITTVCYFFSHRSNWEIVDTVLLILFKTTDQ